MAHKVLLVDDEPSIRTLLGAVLRAKGYEVSTAEDGFDALRAIRENVPDLIITDMRMPNMNGFELLAVVREKFPSIPVVAISGEFVGEQVQGVLADLFLQKGSYSPNELLDQVARLLSVERKHRGSASGISPVWAPTGDAKAMVTCCDCLKSFPLDPCVRDSVPNQVDCIFCGAHLQYRLIGVTRSA